MDPNVIEQLELFALFAGISLLILIFAYCLRVFRVEGGPWPGKVASSDLFGAFLFFLGMHMVVAPATMLLVMKWGPEAWQSKEIQIWVGVYAMYLGCFALYLYSAKLTDFETYLSLFPRLGKKAGEAFCTGIPAFFVAYPLVIATGMFIRLIQRQFFGIDERDQAAVQALKLSLENPLLSGLMIAGVVFFVPIAEELLFRGYLQGWLRRFFPAKGAIFLTSLIFAAFHFSLKQGWSNVEFLASLFVLSLLLGLLYEKQRSLWAPIALHMLFNGVNVVLLTQAQL